MADSDVGADALAMHKKFGGKIKISLRDPDMTYEKLQLYYTPGVAAVSSYVAEHPKQLRDYSWVRNTVAVISDGSAVLGLGNIGPYGAMPVMEGKSMLFKHFANIDSVPIVLDVHSADEIVSAVAAIAPSFGGINLEDIAAPICFEVEERLAAMLPIPVMHDDQHGTATVVLAGLINACKVTGREIKDCKIVIVGAGAAGVAVAKLIYKYAQPQITVVDSKGIINAHRTDLNDAKKRLLEFSDQSNAVADGSLTDALKGADVFIGVSQPGVLTADMIASMADEAIVFALANPVPEIMPNEAKAAGAAVVATGRSDFPNQINNALVFPGIFRGALDNQVRQITDDHKIAAAETVASFVANPDADNIVPRIDVEGLVAAIATKIT